MEKINNNNFLLKKIVYGGLFSLDEENIELRKLQIKSDNFLHTCNDYDKSLEVIKLAYEDLKIKPKIFSKVFFNYPNSRSKRYRSIYRQLEETVSRLNILPNDWVIQFSCYCDPNYLLNKDAEILLSSIKSEFGISKLLFEYYPVYGYDLTSLLTVKNYYKDLLDIGIIGYQNQYNGVFEKKQLLDFKQEDFTVTFISFLGLNRNISNEKTSLRNSIIMDKNIRYFLKSNRVFKNFYGITKTSTINHFYDLQKKLILIDASINQDNIINIDIFNQSSICIDYKFNDPYFSKFKFNLYFRKPILILNNIINFLIYIFKRKNHKRDSWKDNIRF